MKLQTFHKDSGRAVIELALNTSFFFPHWPQYDLAVLSGFPRHLKISFPHGGDVLFLSTASHLKALIMSLHLLLLTLQSLPI